MNFCRKTTVFFVFFMLFYIDVRQISDCFLGKYCNVSIVRKQRGVFSQQFWVAEYLDESQFLMSLDIGKSVFSNTPIVSLIPVIGSLFIILLLISYTLYAYLLSRSQIVHSLPCTLVTMYSRSPIYRARTLFGLVLSGVGML
jgi:hypothetical protein